MSLLEIFWRILEQTKKIIDKYKYHKRDDSFFSPGKKIFRLAVHCDNKMIAKLFPKTAQYHLSIAEQTIHNQLSAFGIDISYGKRIEWNRDPVTQKFWPKKFWGDIDYRNKTLGGVKFVWEINRLYFLVSLGISYRLTKNKKYADKAVWIIKSWLKDNPYPVGVNWASGIEAGVRLANLIWTLSFFEDYLLSHDDRKTINSFVCFHADHLYRYPSKYSSSNNHFLAEGFGLFIAGLYFPHLKHSKKWFGKGKLILEKEVNRQILEDGGSFEYSTTYLSFVFDFFLLFKISCDTCGIKYNLSLNKRLEKACEFLKSVMDKNGNIPNIGDQDSAVLVNFGLSNLENCSSILNTASLLFNRKDFFTGTPDLKTWLLTGVYQNSMYRDSDKRQKKNSRENQSRVGKPFELPNKCSLLLHKQSGLAIIRDYIEKKEVLFVGNAMPLGMAPLYAHGHLDALSFTLSLDGLEFFIDPGTYLYHRGEKWRTYFRSTAAHNTIRINEQDMSKQIGDFMFGKPYRINRNSLKRHDGYIVWEAGLEAYSKQMPCLNINRQVVWRLKENQFVVSDFIISKKKVLAELFFHLHPLCKVKNIDGEVVIQRDEIEIIILPDIRGNIEILKGYHDPIAGWYSANFNEIIETHTIRFYKILDGKEKITTSISLKCN
ncbi:alginate lyase family protein [Desulfobacula phenolica]|uniref:Heparinase II/III N-terminus n=1 Tax=Desulfobacula phenolica TaxID=90732 RepID=A0A1H2DTU8_9BACT|nr:alginate lyase family protein [Desulfobacula phenolica]SDT86266.1 Heparinase II/III N-terminus [Desulfobacula phenolica]